MEELSDVKHTCTTDLVSVMDVMLVVVVVVVFFLVRYQICFWVLLLDD